MFRNVNKSTSTHGHTSVSLVPSIALLKSSAVGRAQRSNICASAHRRSSEEQWSCVGVRQGISALHKHLWRDVFTWTPAGVRSASTQELKRAARTTLLRSGGEWLVFVTYLWQTWSQNAAGSQRRNWRLLPLLWKCPLSLRRWRSACNHTCIRVRAACEGPSLCSLKPDRDHQS